MEINSGLKHKKRGIVKTLRFALPILFIGLVMFLIPLHFVHAQAATFFSKIGYSVIGTVCFAVAYIISYVMGLLIAIETWLVGVILNINSGVFNSTIVQTGFSVSLSIANLGFIFGIIVIAIATILQNQTYGIKQILWKLVVMAVLVNFGLVIMGAIFGFADQFTNYFLQCIDPSGGCGNTSQGVLGNDMDFASSLAGAFAPQTGFLAVSVNSSAANTIMANFGTDIASMLTPIFSLVFTAVSLIAIVITLAAFVVMLLVRYVYIAILAVLLPFAWMLWVFPKTSSNFDKWWAKFIQWTFFAPIVLFFLWLALTTVNNMNSGTTNQFSVYTANSGIFGTISTFFGAAFTPIITNALKEIVLIALIVGGMMAAQALSITGAEEALGAIKGGSKGLGKWAAKTTGRGAAKGAAWVVKPKERRDAHGVRYTPLPTTRFGRLRQRAAAGLTNTANSPGLQSHPGVVGAVSSVWVGARAGSGIWKKKMWQCQQCFSTYPQKPAGGRCPNPSCPDPANPNWKQV